MRRVVFKARFLWIVLLAMIVGGWPMAAQAAALPTAPSLGTAASFAVLAGSAVTCTTSTVTGDVGVSPGATVTGFPPQAGASCTIINGTIHPNDPAAIQANSDFRGAYSGMATHLTPCTPKSGTLAGKSLGRGVYCFDGAAALTGTLKLTGTGPWIFEIGTGVTTCALPATCALAATTFTVVGGNPCNVFWWVNAAVTLTGSTFQGTILAGAAITLTNTSLTGRALASGRGSPPASAVQTAVTMSTNSNILGCLGGSVPGTKCTPGTSTDVDENSEQSKDTANSNKSVISAAAGASQSSNGDSKDENGKQDSDEGNKGCNSDNSNQDNSNKDKKS